MREIHQGVRDFRGTEELEYQGGGIFVEFQELVGEGTYQLRT